MVEAWTSLLTIATVDPIATAAFFAFLVLMAIVGTWPWGLYDDEGSEDGREG